jgi:hypothetical protein
LKKLRKGKDLRPFSSYPEVSDVPFVLYMDYKEEEVKDAIDLLRKDGIIKVVYDVFPGEMRYDIADEDLKCFVKDVWLVHDYDFRLLIERLVYNRKPVDEDKNYLKSFFGNLKKKMIVRNERGLQENSLKILRRAEDCLSKT